MPHYVVRGEIPKKRHTQFRGSEGTLYAEEVMGVRGFSGIQSILYHHAPPTQLLKVIHEPDERISLFEDHGVIPLHLVGMNFRSEGDPITSRKWLLVNQDIKIGLATPTHKMEYFYRNGGADELLFVHSGSGTLRSQFGILPFYEGDYLVIPVGTTYQIETSKESKFLVTESRGRVEIPNRYRNEYGQLLEHAPFCERDFRVPSFEPPQTKSGEFTIRLKVESRISTVVVKHHPFDVIGWDGYLYPWAFNIGDFEPITGRIHQPPPVHQTFSGTGYVVCSFVPRLFDYHPLAIPVPYNHSNVNSDEVLYYVKGNFMSRKGVQEGSFTVHPAGLPHGPHPGTVEASLGAKETHELAVMIDTFHPLQVTQDAASLLDNSYERSWTV